MGRHTGHIALNVGVAGGAEAILVPEAETDAQNVIDAVNSARKRGKDSSVIVVAEGAYPGGAVALAEQLHAKCGYEVRTSILGHVQRGGSPSTRDRVLASRLGHAAVLALLKGRSGVMVGVDKRGTVFVPLKEVFESTRAFDWELYETAKVLAV